MENQPSLKCLKCGSPLYHLILKADENIVSKQEVIFLTKPNLEKLNQGLSEIKSEIWDCPRCNRVYLKDENNSYREKYREVQEIFRDLDMQCGTHIMPIGEYRKYHRELKLKEERNMFIDSMKDKSKSELLTLYTKYLERGYIKKSWDKPKLLERIAQLEISFDKVKEKYKYEWCFTFYPDEAKYW